jgi:hypothetical protein
MGHMADFELRMPRQLSEGEAEKLQQSGITCRVGDYVDGRPLSTFHVRSASDEQDAKRRAIEILGLTEQESASLTVRPAAERSD